VYKNSDKRKREAWKSTIDDLKRKNERLEKIIGSSKRNLFAEAVERVQQLRGDMLASPRSKASATTELSDHLRDDSRGHSLAAFDIEYVDLPPEDITRQAVSSFFSCGSTLFHIIPQEACENLIRRVYEQAADVTKSDVCQVCALAAVGGQYCTDVIPDSAKEKYFQYASLLLQDALEEDALVSMRIFICLAIYLILIKSTSARTMTGKGIYALLISLSLHRTFLLNAVTASGLNIARWNMQKWMQKASHEDCLEWAKVFRTLAFTEW
jgi:hypothetical protein